MTAKLGKNVFREILMRMDDETLLKTCKIDRRTYHDVCDDQFFHRRLQQKYPDTIKNKHRDTSYRYWYLEIVYYIALLKEDYDYVYTKGDPKNQFYIFYGISWNDNKNIYKLSTESAQSGELELVKYAIENRENVWLEGPLIPAVENGHLDIIKYLVEQGANIHYFDNAPIKIAIKKGYTEIVDYLQSLP